MAKQRHRTVDLLRRLLLVVLLLGVAGLVALYLFGRAGRPLEPEPEEDTALADDEAPQGEITLVGEGFEFTHSEADQPVFRIRGESVRADRGGTVYLDGVALTLYDERGTAYDIAADRATFNQEKREARLAGDVMLRGPDDTSLATRGLRLVERGKVLLSTGPVRFTYRTLRGTADSLRIDLDKDEYLLTGAVHVETGPLPAAAAGTEATAPPPQTTASADGSPDADATDPAPPQRATLDCKRLAFDGARHLVRANGDVVINRGDDRLEAALINVFLDEEDRVAVFLRARWSVRGRMTVATRDARTGAPGTRTLSLSGRSLSLLRTPAGQPANAELEGAARVPAVIESPTDRGTVQRLVAGYLVGSFDRGLLTSVRAFNSPSVVEVDPRIDGAAGELRHLTGTRMEASFAGDGRVVALDAEENVVYRDGAVELHGDAATFDTLEEKGVFTGDPVRIDSDRGEVLAPKVTYERPAGLVYAEEGVRTVARDAREVGLDGTPLGAGEGPLRVESREAFWRDDPRSVLFRGEVRAWRGDNLLLADAVRADQTAGGGDGAAGGRQVRASGGVRTVWIPPPAEGGAAVPAQTAGAQTGGPVEVTANNLEYQELRSLLVYEGRVRAERGDRVLTCRRLDVELDDAGEAQRLICVGDAVLDDRPAGNRARGARAVYDLHARTVTMSGNPVTLTKSDGAQVQGGRVEYDLDSGKARVLAEEPAPPAATQDGAEGDGGAAAETPDAAAAEEGR